MEFEIHEIIGLRVLKFKKQQISHGKAFLNGSGASLGWGGNLGHQMN